MVTLPIAIWVKALLVLLAGAFCDVLLTNRLRCVASMYVANQEPQNRNVSPEQPLPENKVWARAGELAKLRLAATAMVATILRKGTPCQVVGELGPNNRRFSAKTASTMQLELTDFYTTLYGTKHYEKTSTN